MTRRIQKRELRCEPPQQSHRLSFRFGPGAQCGKSGSHIALALTLNNIINKYVANTQPILACQIVLDLRNLAINNNINKMGVRIIVENISTDPYSSQKIISWTSKLAEPYFAPQHYEHIFSLTGHY